MKLCDILMIIYFLIFNKFNIIIDIEKTILVYSLILMLLIRYNSIIINYLDHKFCHNSNIELAFIYFNYQENHTLIDLLENLLKYLIQ